MVAIVKYNAGNIYSVVNALRRLGVEPLLTDSAEELRRADKVIFPGQGEAATVMASLRNLHLDEVIPTLTQPVLGICVGMQMLCKHSEEGDVDCLGVFDAPVIRFRPQRREDKVPAMGWNRIEPTAPLNPPKGGRLFDSLGPEPYCYFLHSYYVPLCNETIASAEHILKYSAALQKDNFFATQFHPEKSGRIGEKIIENFLRL